MKSVSFACWTHLRELSGTSRLRREDGSKSYYTYYKRIEVKLHINAYAIVTKMKQTSGCKVPASAAHCVVVHGAVQDHHMSQCARLVGRTLAQLGKWAGVEALSARLAHCVCFGGACQSKTPTTWIAFCCDSNWRSTNEKSTLAHRETAGNRDIV